MAYASMNQSILLLHTSLGEKPEGTSGSGSIEKEVPNTWVVTSRMT